MKNLFGFLLKIALVFLLLSGHWAKAAHPNDDEGYHTDQIYLALTPEAAARIIHTTDQTGARAGADNDAFLSTFGSLFQGMDIQTIRVPFPQADGSPLVNVLHLFVDTGTDLTVLCDALNKHPAVVYAERVPEVKFFESVYPNDLSMDSNYSGQWYLHKIQAPEAWKITKGSSDIRVAVVDQAIDSKHPDLKSVIWTNPDEIPDNGIDDDGNGYVDDVQGYDVAEDDPDVNPDHSGQTHGTHVAGLVSAKSDNGIGIASIGFNLSLIPVKCAYAQGSGARQYEGVTYAAKAGADIISCSWGGAPFSLTHKNVIEYAQQQGALVVCSSGNDGSDLLGYPAAYDGVISVGATNILDRMASFSNYNEKLSVSAPGNNIISTLPENTYGSYSGTSMSTPIVSGLLGLMKSHYPQISNQELKDCLLSTTDPVAISLNKYDGKTGSGRINAYKAILCVDALKQAATGIEETEARPLRIYPNPSQGKAYLEVSREMQGIIRLKVSDLLGRVLLNKQYPKNLTNRILIRTEDWAAGVYLIELHQGETCRQGKLIVK